jgi:hypothetical protein
MGMAKGEAMQYVGSPKHKSAPSRGRRGSLCPADIDQARAQTLLESGLPTAGAQSKRFCTDGKRAFCAQRHDAARNEWHGYPVAWHEVPPKICRRWLEDGTITERIRRGRSGSQ